MTICWLMQSKQRLFVQISRQELLELLERTSSKTVVTTLEPDTVTAAQSNDSATAGDGDWMRPATDDIISNVTQHVSAVSLFTKRFSPGSTGTPDTRNHSSYREMTTLPTTTDGNTSDSSGRILPPWASNNNLSAPQSLGM